MQTPAYVFISAHKVRLLEDALESYYMVIKESNQRFLHCIVDADSYYGHHTGRFYSEMVDADK